MGKGDKKTKRGKIVIGSFGVRRSRKAKKSTPAPKPRATAKPADDTEEAAAIQVKAAKKAVKKTEEHTEAGEKPKVAARRKKADETPAGTTDAAETTPATSEETAPGTEPEEPAQA